MQSNLFYFHEVDIVMPIIQGSKVALILVSAIEKCGDVAYISLKLASRSFASPSTLYSNVLMF